MFLKNNNVIVGLLKNLVRKNQTNGHESIKVIGPYFFEIELDVSGFDESLILQGLETLCSDTKWYKIGKNEILSGDITNPRYDPDIEKVHFHIIKDKFIRFRDLTLSEKQNI